MVDNSEDLGFDDDSYSPRGCAFLVVCVAGVVLLIAAAAAVLYAFGYRF